MSIVEAIRWDKVTSDYGCEDFFFYSLSFFLLVIELIVKHRAKT